MKLFNRTKKEEQNNTETKKEKKENKVIKFVKDHKVGIGYGVLLIAAFVGGYISPNRRPYDCDETLDDTSSDDLKYAQPRYDVGIDDAFATVAYDDGDIGFVGMDYIPNLADRIVELRKETE